MIKASLEKNIKISSILEVRKLSKTAFVLRFDKNNLDFIAGQHIALGLPDVIDTREYSIYSSEQDSALEVLIKEVVEGYMSPKFGLLKAGDKLKIMKPVGYFTIPENLRKNRKFVFVASGTGIAPFHSIANSYSEMDYQILHGIAYEKEAYERNTYPKGRYISCTSKDTKGDFNGRVTKYLQKNTIDTKAIYYLCGNYEMIDEVYGILEKAGVPAENIKAEVYF